MYQIDNVSFQYFQDTKDILQCISLDIKKGEFLVICGKSGCGKTTLLKHLKKTMIPQGKTSGTIYYDNKDIVTLTRQEDIQIGYVFQNPSDQMVMDQVWHELAFGLENQGMELSLMKRRVSEIANYFNLQDILYQSVDTLSGGVKQMVNLAAIVAMNPDVILLDEPTAQLDPIHAMDFIKMVKQLHEDFDITIIMVEHQLEYILDKADRLLVMDQGQVLYHDKVKEVVIKMIENQKLVSLLPEYMQIVPHKETIPLSIKEAKQVCKNQAISYNERDMYIPQNIAIKIKDMYFGYQQPVLKHIDLKIYQDDFLVIVGANGCGKTTLLKCIAEVLPYHGKVKWQIVKQIGYVPQDPTTLFLKATVKEELLAMSNNSTEVDKMLEQMHLTDYQDSHPYDLSGGQKQLLALAKILLLKPTVLLLDEPTKGMDGYCKDEIGTILLQLSNTIPIICVSHDIEFSATYSKRSAMLFNGQVVAIENTHEFFKNNVFYTTALHKVMKNICDDIVTKQDVLL